MSNLTKKYPWLLTIGLPLVLFVVLSYAYFSPTLEGKALRQHDVLHAKGMQQEANNYHKTTGDYTLWTNSAFGGMPMYQIGSGGAPNHNIYAFLTKFLKIFPLYSVDLLVFYLLGFFVLMLALNIKSWLAVAGSIAFGLSTYNIILIGAGHVNKALVIATIPAVLAGVLLTFDKKYVRGFLVTLVAFGINIMYNHFQMTYYMFLLLGCFAIVWLVKAIREKELPGFAKASVVVVLALALGLLPNITKLWTTYEYTKETIRGGSELAEGRTGNRATGLDKSYALSYSYGIDETLTLLIPGFKGGASMGKLNEQSALYKEMMANGVPANQARNFIKQVPTYWGELPITSGPIYFGAGIVFLFVVGLFLVKGYIKWWLLSGTILTIMLSWGFHLEWFSDLFLNYFPLYNKFRAVSSILVIPSVTVLLLAILTLQGILQGQFSKADILKKGKYALYITGGLCLFFALFGSSLFSFSASADDYYRNAGYPAWFLDALMSDRAFLLRRDAFRSLIMILLTAGFIWAYINQKMKESLFLGLFALLTLVDLWPVNKRYVGNDDFVQQTKAKEIIPTQADLQLLQDSDPNFRVYNLTVNPFTDSHTSYFHKSLGGYHGAKLVRYQDLIEHHLSKQNLAVINMLNTKYIIVPGENNQPVVQRNINALGNAWFVDGYQVVDGAREEIEALNGFNPLAKAIVDRQFYPFVEGVDTLQQDSVQHQASIRMTAYRPSKITYAAQTELPRIAVFSEIYYNDQKGWSAYLNGEHVKHFRVNYVLRAMVVPPGKHEIEFRFGPRSFQVGQKIAIASSLFTVLIVLSGLGLLWRKKRKGQ